MKEKLIKEYNERCEDIIGRYSSEDYYDYDEEEVKQLLEDAMNLLCDYKKLINSIK